MTIIVSVITLVRHMIAHRLQNALNGAVSKMLIPLCTLPLMDPLGAVGAADPMYFMERIVSGTFTGTHSLCVHVHCILSMNCHSSLKVIIVIHHLYSLIFID